MRERWKRCRGEQRHAYQAQGGGGRGKPHFLKGHFGRKPAAQRQLPDALAPVPPRPGESLAEECVCACARVLPLCCSKSTRTTSGGGGKTEGPHHDCGLQPYFWYGPGGKTDTRCRPPGRNDVAWFWPPDHPTTTVADAELYAVFIVCQRPLRALCAQPPLRKRAAGENSDPATRPPSQRRGRARLAALFKRALRKEARGAAPAA